MKIAISVESKQYSILHRKINQGHNSPHMTRYIDQNNLSRRNIKKGIFLFGIKLRKKSCIYSNKRKSVLFIKKLLLRLTHSYLGIATITSLGVRARIFGCYKCRKHIQYIHVFTSI